MGQLATAISTLAPIGWWKFNESSGTNANDEVSTNDGTYVDFGSGGFVLGQPSLVTAETDTCVRIVQSIGGNITWGDIAAFNFLGVAQFTAIVWGKLVQYNSGTGSVIFDNAGSFINGWSMDLENPTVTIGGYRSNAVTFERATIQVTVASLLTPRLYSVCYDGTNVKVGLDGTYIASTPSSLSQTNDAVGMAIGGGAGGGSYWDGWFQNAAIFDRALSETELATLVSASNLPQPVAWIRA